MRAVPLLRAGRAGGSAESIRGVEGTARRTAFMGDTGLTNSEAFRARHVIEVNDRGRREATEWRGPWRTE